MNRLSNRLSTPNFRVSRWLTATAAVLAMVWSSLAFAQTQYVSDIFYVPVRSGAGTQFRIVHQGLRSGTPVQVHETEEGWARITTEGGVEGWMEAQYLLESPPARVQMPQLEQRLKQTQEQNAKLNARIRELEQENNRLQTQVNQLEEAHSAAVTELEEIRNLSADAVNLNRRHRELLEQHQMLQTEVNTLQAENDRLKNDTTVDKWLFGAGLVLFGIFLSIVLPALKPKKRFSDWA